jgi:putative transposon-encoded protein
MLKKGNEIVLDLFGCEILKRNASKFGTGAHVIISKEYIGKKVKIIIGKSKIIGEKIKIDFSESVILDGKASKFGTGCHVIVPKEYSEKEVKIII